jgi:hypothetical protein
VGLGYKFNSSDISTKQTLNLSGLRNELSILLGISIVDIPEEHNGFAISVEYRRNLWSHVDFTVSYLNEGKNDGVARQGIAVQLWATQKISDCISIGIGGGLYVSNWEEDSTFLFLPRVDIKYCPFSRKIQPSMYLFLKSP